MKRHPDVIAGVRSSLEELEANEERLSQWERDFVFNLNASLEKYGDNAWLTDGQLSKLKDIVEKLER